jgi:ATP-dependent Clp protease ATP-binding subunit ClpB
VGFEEGGQLTEAVRRRPFSVVLFDEIEKAHADVFNVLLQVLDDGRLTDGQGRTVDFKNTIVVMTSNLVFEELDQHFRPEFLNRVDDIIVFHALTEEHLKKIIDIQLAGLLARLAERGITLQISDAARTHIIRQGYDPRYGARPLKRAIQKQIETPIARMILAGTVKDGFAVDIGWRNGALSFDAHPRMRTGEAAAAGGN